MPAFNIPKLFPSVEQSVIVRYSEDPILSSIGIHSHNFIEFGYIIEGYGVETINQDSFDIKPGYFSIIYPWQTHELRFNPGKTFKYFFVAISMDNFLGIGSVALELKDLFFRSGYTSSPNYYFEGNDILKLNQTFQEMYAELNAKKKWWELSVKSRIFDVLILFDRQLNSQTNERNLQTKHYPSQQTMDIIFYIYSNFKDDLSLSALSEIFGLSQNYLSTIIKACLGLSFSDFLHNLRLKYACSLLASTTMSVTDIAYTSGFQSYRNFVRFFRKYYSVSPMNFRYISNEKNHYF